MNLPNTITLVRMALVFVMTLAVAVDGLETEGNEFLASPPNEKEVWVPVSAGAVVALWAFVIGALTDFIDGYIARRYNLVTTLGKLIDPLADKMLVTAALVYLTCINLCPFWVAVLIIFREFLVTGLRQLAAAQGYVMPADWCGKWKTTFQLAFCIACLLGLAYGGSLPEPLLTLVTGNTGYWVRCWLLVASVVLTFWSGANYCWQCRRLLR